MVCAPLVRLHPTVENRIGVRRVLRELTALYWDSGIAADIPALAWFLLSSLAPLALGLTALAAIVLGDWAEAQALAAKVSGIFPQDVHDQIVTLVLRTQKNSALLIAGAIVAMVWITSGAVGVIDRCLKRVLRVQPGTANAVVGKLRNSGVALAVAVVVVLMVIAASWSTGLAERLGVNSTLARVAALLLGIGLISVVCTSVFRVLAGDATTWKSALIGGAVSGTLLQLTPTVVGIYMRYTAGNTPVHVFLILAGVLVTCYLAAAGLLLGVGVMARVQLARPLAGAATS